MEGWSLVQDSLSALVIYQLTKKRKKQKGKASPSHVALDKKMQPSIHASKNMT
jgi:hypothetical protein